MSRTFDEYLGDPAQRYFSRGYLAVLHDLGPVSLCAQGSEGIEARARGRVEYPEDWSIGADGRVRDVHLSSVDAIILLVRMLEALGRQLGDEALATATITRLEVRAGTSPCTMLADVPVSLSMRRGPSDPMRVRARVGGFALRAELRRSGYRAPRGAAVHPYSDGYRSVDVHSVVESWDPARQSISTSHELTTSVADRGSLTGIDAGVWPGLTHVGNLLLFGQMAQVLVLLTSGIGRGAPENLWVRRLELTRDRGIPRRRFAGAATLIRHRVLDRGGSRYHSLDLAARSGQGVAATATFGFVSRGVSATG